MIFKCIYCSVKYLLCFFCLGLRIPELLEAILKLFPLDSYVDCPVGNAVLWQNHLY